MTKVVYFLKRPGNGRASFALIKRTQTDGRRTHETIENEQLNAVNTAFRSGALNLTEAGIQAATLVTGLNKQLRLETRGAYVANEANRKLLEQYWKEVYESKKIQHAQARARLQWAIELLGPIPILGDRIEVQKWVDSATANQPRRQRRVVAVLNQIRHYFGCQGKLAPERRTAPQFKYLTEAEFQRVLLYVDDSNLELLFQVLFSTGARTGEAFAIQTHRNGIVVISGQINRDGSRVPTKTGRSRKTVVIPGFSPIIQQWVEIPQKEREVAHRNSLSRIWKQACQKVFPRNPDKWTTVHDLRHSYAVYMLEKGVTVATIAKLLGNSVMVCEEYYLNFIPEDEALQGTLAKLMQ